MLISFFDQIYHQLIRIVLSTALPFRNLQKFLDYFIEMDYYGEN